MELAEQVAMVLAVFALLGALLWFLKRRGFASMSLVPRRGGNARRVEVLERVPLTPQHVLHLVRVSDKVLLISTAPSGCTLLQEPALKEQAPSFGQDLARLAQ
ncbi:MAG TPA: flagellar biosynthetic protein FliO [Bryobacteraceae bacterium]|jgi:flagellar biosynthetic protein FliO|nr:flagellar biosynthetic protein FliO [Bryobacteraceae bacterium]